MLCKVLPYTKTNLHTLITRQEIHYHNTRNRTKLGLPQHRLSKTAQSHQTRGKPLHATRANHHTARPAASPTTPTARPRPRLPHRRLSLWPRLLHRRLGLRPRQPRLGPNMMETIQCKEEQIEDVAYTYEYSDNNLSELAFGEPVIHNYESTSSSSNAFKNYAACHFFFPKTEDFNERTTPQAQVDPLALNSDICDYQSESVSIDDELLALHTDHISSFSIIDPLNITEQNIFESNSKIDLLDQPKEKILTETRKRHIKEENKLQENLFSPPSKKKIKLEENLIDHEKSLKKALVCIGPKLQLPIPLQLQLFDNDQSVSTKTEKLSSTSSLETDQQEPIQNKRIVLKVYTCSKCNFKHTDSVLHEAHVATCVSISTRDVSTSQACIYKDQKGLFCCEFCAFKFKNKINLIRHQNKHVKIKGFTCYVCDVQLVSVKKLQLHYQDVHKNHSKIFSCNLCEYSSVTASRLKEHMVTHNTDKYLHCYKCRQNYDDVNDFNQHACKKINNMPLKIKKLPEDHKSSVKERITNHDSVKFSNLKSAFESEIILKNDTYYCNGCTYTFSKYDCLKTHKKEHLKFQPYKCSVCKYKSFSVVDISNHVRCHFSEERKRRISIKCNVCHRTFDRTQNIRQHAVSHIYDGLFCSSCKINFEDSQTLVQHMDSSHNQSVKDQMYSCSICSFTHPVASSLKRHMKRHLLKKSKTSLESNVAMDIAESRVKCSMSPKNITLANETNGNNKNTGVFKCTSCRIRFDNAAAFEKHNNDHLSKSTRIKSDQSEKDRSKLSFKCNKCKHECLDVNSFIKHIRFNHLNREKPFTCLVCDLKMESLKTYLPHLQSHNEIPTYSCQYCKFHTRTKKSFLQHHIKHNLKCCPMCIYSTQNFQAFRDHIKRQHKSRNAMAPFVCTLCPYRSNNEKVLSIHALKFHPKEYPSLRLPIPNYLKKSLVNTGDKTNACGMCQFTNNRIHDFKRHLTKHFVNGKLDVKILRKGPNKKSLALKSSYPTKLKTCKNKPSISDDIVWSYACSQCNFRKKNRKSVSDHLFSTHNIKGGVRNNMILKLNAPTLKNTHNKKLKDEKDIMKCKNCEVGKFSLLAQKQHKSLGHKGFWARPFSCIKCKSRFKGKMYLDRHECKKGRPKPLICKTCNKYKTIFEQKMKNHSQICTGPSTTTTETSNPSHCQQNIKTLIVNKSEGEELLSSDDESFSCGECNFNTTDVTALINHMFIHSGVQDD